MKTNTRVIPATLLDGEVQTDQGGTGVAMAWRAVWMTLMACCALRQLLSCIQVRKQAVCIEFDFGVGLDVELADQYNVGSYCLLLDRRCCCCCCKWVSQSCGQRPAPGFPNPHQIDCATARLWALFRGTKNTWSYFSSFRWRADASSK